MIPVSGCFPVWVLIFFLCFEFSSCEISCKDENNNDVDWYVNYKIPAIRDEPEDSNLKEGTAYAYMTAPGTGSWILSKNSIDDGSMLERTLENFYSERKTYTSLFYNDDPPSGFKGHAAGHAKGVLVFDGKTGFWLVHSIPRFADDEDFIYPENGLIYGQSILCVTFETSELNNISKQLLYSNPNIYSYSITEEVEEMLDDKAVTLFSDKPEFVKTGDLEKIISLKSLKNKEFVSFAKDHQLKVDIYSSMIAPRLKSSLTVETWRRGSKIPVDCDEELSVMDVTSLNMRFTSGKQMQNIEFKSSKDHSKWAISEEGDENWVCIADLNRMRSQEKRGGGALCFVSAPVNKAFHSLISETEECPEEKSS